MLVTLTKHHDFVTLVKHHDFVTLTIHHDFLTSTKHHDSVTLTKHQATNGICCEFIVGNSETEYDAELFGFRFVACHTTEPRVSAQTLCRPF